MDWVAIGGRIRKQREYLGLTREQFAEKLDITPKFCADIELGTKGMSVPTLCRIATTLSLSTDYILFGRTPDISSGARDVMINDDLSHIIVTVPLSKRDAIKNIVKSVLPYIK